MVSEVSQTQFVEIDDMKSSYQHVPCGVPQGSILGPLLYLIYVNDIWKSCDSKIFSFADDTTLCVSSPNLDDLYDTINNKAIRDGKYLALPHSSAWQRSPLFFP